MATFTHVLIDPGDGVDVSRVHVKLDPRVDNICRIYGDGLWAGIDGTSYSVDVDGSANTSTYIADSPLEPFQFDFGVNVDYGPWSGFDHLKHDDYYNAISCRDTVHRIWNATFSSEDLATGKKKPINLTGKDTSEPFRKGCDWVLPGDFFRVQYGSNYNYYIITQVTGDDDTPGNEIADYDLLAEGLGDF